MRQRLTAPCRRCPTRPARLLRLAVTGGLLAPAVPVAAQDAAPAASPAAGAAAAVTPGYFLFDTARVAWAKGQYVEALESLERLLTGPDAERWRRPVARLTGELYVTTELAPDGRAARWSPDGRWAAYETGTAAETETRLIRFDPGADARAKAPAARPAGIVRGTGLVFAPAGDRAAYLRLGDGEKIRDARAEAQRLIETRDFAGARAKLREAAIRERAEARLFVRELRSGRDREVRVRKPAGVAGDLALLTLFYDRASPLLYVTAAPTEAIDSAHIYRVSEGEMTRVTRAPGPKEGPVSLADGWILYGTGPGAFELVSPGGEGPRRIEGRDPAPSADGRTVAYVGWEGDEEFIAVAGLEGGDPTLVRRTSRPLARPALSPDGARVAYQMMPREDWELYVSGAEGGGEIRLTREIQHDLFPAFLSPDRLLAVIGEFRHRRAQLYDLAAFGEGPDPAALAALPGPDKPHRTRLFHNNTLRTVAPQYEWVPSPDGARLLVVAERDGNTISPERGLYLVELTREVTLEALRARVAEGLASERRLRAAGERAFAPIAAAVREAVADASAARIYGYAHDLYLFDTKFMTEPGNAKAIEYLAATLRSFGYEPELQWFEPRPGVRSANVIARLPGTLHPELIYVVSSHFDSVEPGPGADDNSSGTSALLEAARVMATRPQPATLHFAFFTAEEAGLFGSREYARRAVAAGDRVVGALNNDMLGYANDGRPDNTIRYSNDGIRDIQHAAAFLFTDLITYDARYYKNTDAHALFDAFGDVVGGIGSYPILGNPHYHQPHDVLETVDQRLVAEVSKTTIATLMLLASSPSRLSGLEVTAGGGGTVEARWTPAAERDVTGYVVTWGPPGGPARDSMRVEEPRVRVAARPGEVVAVRAVNARGLEGWDWARAGVE